MQSNEIKIAYIKPRIQISMYLLFSQFRWIGFGFFLVISILFIEFSTFVIYVRVFSQRIANYASIESFSTTTLPISYKTIRTKPVFSRKGTVFALLFLKEIVLANSFVKYHLVGILSRFLLDFFPFFLICKMEFFIKIPPKVLILFC